MKAVETSARKYDKHSTRLLKCRQLLHTSCVTSFLGLPAWRLTISEDSITFILSAENDESDRDNLLHLPVVTTLQWLTD
jgi:hypothetical protein